MYGILNPVKKIHPLLYRKHRGGTEGTFLFFLHLHFYFRKTKRTMLGIPLKYTEPVDIVTPIRNYLSSKYPKVCTLL